MDALYLWPEQPALSLFALWLVSSIFLWAAREPMLNAVHGLLTSLEEGLRAASAACVQSAAQMRERYREALVAAGVLDLHAKLDREFQRIDDGFSEKLGHYGELHRRLDSLVGESETAYDQCGQAPPEAPGWTGAVESIASLPSSNDPNVHKVLDGIRKSMQDGQKKALESHRADCARRHKILSRMLPTWKEVRSLLVKMQDSVSRALETTTRVHQYVEDYEKLREDRAAAARALSYSAVKVFVTSVVVLVIALGGAFINFQLIALPMSELVPAGTRVGGVPVSTVAAMVIVLMEAVLGLFAMDMLGVTDLFPKLSQLPTSRRRLILGLAVGGLFFLAAVESSLAILREQIVAADAALKLALADTQQPGILAASNSKIPVIGQAVLGFVLPWVLAVVAVPLEMLLDSGRHVLGALAAFGLSVLAQVASVAASLTRALAALLTSIYDVYIAIPLRIERLVGGRSGGGSSGGSTGRKRDARVGSQGVA